jgi:hypothetical protein
MATGGLVYGTYTALTVSNLQSLANDSTDPFTAWQSDRVDNRTTLAQDYKISVYLPTANTSPANDATAYLYVIPWKHDGSGWVVQANFGTTTLPVGSEGSASISEPNSMGVVSIPYKVAQQILARETTVASVLGYMPQGFSLAIRNCTGAALSTGCTAGYQTINQTI